LIVLRRMAVVSSFVALAWLPVALGLLVAATAGAQTSPPADAKTADADKVIELFRKDVRAEKADIIAKTMKLEAAQAAAFWPVYKAYEAERQAVGDQRLAVIQDLAEH